MGRLMGGEGEKFVWVNIWDFTPQWLDIVS
jgi:hypothetical protein